MAQERPLFPVSDAELLFHLSLACASDNTGFGTNDNSAAAAVVDDGFVFDIDPSLLVDPDKVAIGELIREGSHYVVHKGWYESHPVSIKVMLPERTLDATYECKEKFQREVKLISRIEHRNIVKFIGASVEPSMMIITELMEGGSLQKHMKSICPRTLGLEQSISFALDISRVMEYLHANGIIHRDLNPGNLLLSEDKMLIKLADFGIAREEICGEMTCEAGTYRYMAPELLSKDPLPKGAKKCYDHKADVYSFAIVLWALTKNQIPFKERSELMAAYATAQNMRPSVDEFPRELLPLLQSCWAEDPRARPEFTEITGTLTRILQSCCSTGTAPASVNEIEELDSSTEEECPPSALAPTPESVEDNSKQKHETENHNGCREGSKPKKNHRKRKALFASLHRCFFGN